ncbi:MAG: Ig-like domain-containing protein [Halobacteriales archaeon]|nr:Ig-like domain-containing protein [Halobacteriales archaeon]
MGVLMVTSSLVVLLFQEARAVDITFAPHTAAFAGAREFVVNLKVPAGERLPLEAIDAVVENPGLGGTKVNAGVIERARCAMGGGMDCGIDELQVLGGDRGPITRIRVVGFFVPNGDVASDVFSIGGRTVSTTGYGYDDAYGYGADIGCSQPARPVLARSCGTVDLGYGYGYGYGGDDLVIRLGVTVSCVSAHIGDHFLTVLAETGSQTLGELSSGFTGFRCSGGGGGGGGGSSDGGGAAGGGVHIAVTPDVSGSTASFTITGQTGNIVDIDLSGLGFGFGTLSLNLANDLNGFVGSVTVSTTPTEGALAVPDGFGGLVYFSINLPPGSVAGGSFTFTLTDAQLGGNPPATVTVLHWDGTNWVPLPTTPGAPGGTGTTFTVQMGSFSPFAIVFDQLAPIIGNIRPADGTVAAVQPLLAASVTDNRGVQSVKMFLDGTEVPLSASGGDQVFTPTQALTAGHHTVRVDAVDLSGLQTTKSWSFDVPVAGAGPLVTPRAPTPDGFTNNARPPITADYSAAVGVDTTKVTVSLDNGDVPGAVATATNVTATPATALADGVHTARVAVSDLAGVSNSATWAFTVDTVAPVIGAVGPEGAASGARPTLHASVTDALSGLDSSTIKLLVDGQPVTATASGSEVSATPAKDLAGGSHTAALDITDKAGNHASKTWSFTTQAAGGDLTLPIVAIIVLVVVGGAGYWWFAMRKK